MSDYKYKTVYAVVQHRNGWAEDLDEQNIKPVEIDRCTSDAWLDDVVLEELGMHDLNSLLVVRDTREQAIKWIKNQYAGYP